MVLQGMFGRLVEVQRCCGMEMNVDKVRQSESEDSQPWYKYGMSKTTGECGIFQLYG